VIEKQGDKRTFGIYNEILAALDCIDDGVMIISAARLVEYMNKSAGSIFTPVQTVVDNPTFIEVVRDHECEALLRKCIETGYPQSALVRLRQNNKLLQLNILPTSEKWYTVVIKDLTEKQQLEQIRRDLISNISHEFRTPITSIKLLSETLLDNQDEEAEIRNDFLGKIVFEAEKLSQMADDMGELAAIEKGGSVLNRGANDINSMIEQVVGRLGAQAGSKQIDITTVLDSNLPSVLIDADRIESVLMNLIHNAIKFTGQGGKIRVRVVREGNYILVSVTDTGCGIAPDELPRIFERFYKIDKSRAGEGSGLGLSISRHIINAHGGKIWAESVEGKGSTFYVTLPVAG
jgi:two-component system phosphate regulon sensor histidine kinase PhoR